MEPQERYPNMVVEALEGFALIALAGGTVALVAALKYWHTTRDDAPLKVAVATGIVLATMLAWAMFRAAALIVRYLWIIQAQHTTRHQVTRRDHDLVG